MKKFARWIAVLVALLLVLTLAGCPNPNGGGEQGNNSSNTGNSNGTQPESGGGSGAGGNSGGTGSGSGTGGNSSTTNIIVQKDPESYGVSVLPDLTLENPFAGQSYVEFPGWTGSSYRYGAGVFFNEDGTYLARSAIGSSGSMSPKHAGLFTQWTRSAYGTYTYNAATKTLTLTPIGFYDSGCFFTDADSYADFGLLFFRQQAASAGINSILIPGEFKLALKSYATYRLGNRQSEVVKCSVVDDTLVLESEPTADRTYEYNEDGLKIRFELNDNGCSISLTNGNDSFVQPCASLTGNGSFKGSDWSTKKSGNSAEFFKVGDFEGTYEEEYGSLYFKLTSVTGNIPSSIKNMVGTEYELRQKAASSSTLNLKPVLKTINYKVIGSGGEKAYDTQTYITDSSATVWTQDTLYMLSKEYFTGIYSNEACTRSVIGKEIRDGDPVYVKLDGITAARYNSEFGNFVDNSEDSSVSLIVLDGTKYTVSFNSNGGSAVESQSVTSGEYARKPVTPTKEGYVFEGWYSDVALTTSFDFYYTRIARNITLYAKWAEAVTYTVTFNSNGGSPVPSQTITTAKDGHGGALSWPDNPTKDGYAFAGWYRDAALSQRVYTNGETWITGNTTFYAKWISTYTVTFNTNGGSVVESQTVTSGEYARKPVTPTKEGYFFAGWFSNSELTTPFSFTTAITQNITLYTCWMESSFNTEPLTLEFIDSGTITIDHKWSSLKYTKNGGNLTAATESMPVASGDKICFYAEQSSNTEYIYMSINCTADCYVYGNIMSLVTHSGNTEWNPNEKILSNNYTFAGLFLNNSHIRTHNSKSLYLPATTLTEGCYSGMFYGCTSLTTAPALPATTLTKGCYASIFYGCTSLTTAPALPATTLADYCYNNMFRDCTSLTTAPALPATTLADYCYSSMFDGCTSLTSAPALPATTLTEGCYDFMFYGCTSLTTAPALPATTLAYGCYYYMFYDCIKINHIECLATNMSATDCTKGWLSGVSSNGTFVKASSADWSGKTGTAGIPSGWTVQNAQ